MKLLYTSTLALATIANAFSLQLAADYLHENLVVPGQKVLSSPSAWTAKYYGLDWKSVEDHLKLNPVSNTKSDSKWDFVVKSERTPNHQLRVKKTPESLGLDTVKQYSGYLDIEDDTKHLFFWFFESRNDPVNDPILLWLNGGPGCSSTTGMLFELGPATISPELKPIRNPYSWNNNASVIFLDQPVNVGFSYSEKKVGSSRASGVDVYALLELFFSKFPEYNNGLHISGESYAGHYIPAIATEILSHADRSFSLESLLIGNGITDPLHQSPSYKKMACGEGGYKSVLSEDECDNLDKMLPVAEKLTEACYRFDNAFTCVPAVIADNQLLEPYVKTGLNVYDIRGPCETDGPNCYEGIGYVQEYLNLPEVQSAIGAEATEFEDCAEAVGVSFLYTGDGAKPFHKDVAAVLEAGVPVLIYAGDKDYICNWVGQELWLKELEWSGQDLYNSKTRSLWYSETTGSPAGEKKSSKNLTFLRVYDAGHMVPHDQPENSLQMVSEWLAGTL